LGDGKIIAMKETQGAERIAHVAGKCQGLVFAARAWTRASERKRGCFFGEISRTEQGIRACCSGGRKKVTGPNFLARSLTYKLPLASVYLSYNNSFIYLLFLL
jgi:hypothetical protein